MFISAPQERQEGDGLEVISCAWRDAPVLKLLLPAPGNVCFLLLLAFFFWSGFYQG